MKKTLIKSLFLFISVPLINSVAFGLGTLVHEMYPSVITPEQFNEYQVAMLIMIGLTGVCIPLFELLYDGFKISHRIVNALYLALFGLIAVLTFDQFAFRPYEHGLTFLSVVSLIFTREILSRWMKTRSWSIDR